MARPSNQYDPQSYGSFERIPEGVHKMGIVSAHSMFRDGVEQWEMELMPVEVKYQTKHALRMWLNCDGCVNALFDAAGASPSMVQDREYQPEEFVGKTVACEIIHRDKNGKIYANIRRLYPAFSLKGHAPASTPAPKQAPKSAPQVASSEPFPDDEVIGDQMPF